VNRYSIKILGKLIESFDKLEDAEQKLKFCKILGLDAKLYKERLELQEDPVVLDKVMKVVESEQID
jgi:hypothetical protein